MNETEKQIVIKAAKWLNQHYPTRGDGCWSWEFIFEVLRGGHLGQMNRGKVVQALAAVIL